MILRSITLCLLITGGQSVVAEQPSLDSGLSQCQLPIFDCALRAGGSITGQVLDGENGRELSGTEVRFVGVSGKTVVCSTNERGEFCAEGLSGGVYRVEVDGTALLARLWVAGTAPPNSFAELNILAGGPVIRGQWAAPPVLNYFVRTVKWGGVNPLAVGAVLTTAVGIPVILHNTKSDDNS